MTDGLTPIFRKDFIRAGAETNGKAESWRV